MKNKTPEHILIFGISIIILVNFILYISDEPIFLAIISYCLGIATLREIKKQNNEVNKM